jgi:hypothetical protein
LIFDSLLIVDWRWLIESGGIATNRPIAFSIIDHESRINNESPFKDREINNRQARLR